MALDTPSADPKPRPQRWARWLAIALLAAGALATGLVALMPSSPPPWRPATPQWHAGQSTGSTPAPGQGNGHTTRLSGARMAHEESGASRGREDRSVSDILGSGSVLVIPELSVRAPLVPTGAVGRPGAASLSIPADIQMVGWWDGKVRDGDRTILEDAPAPGQPGVSLIAGHVDSAAAGPGALFYLKDLGVGAIIVISDSTGRRTSWVVDAKPQYTRKTQLPSALWVTTGPPRLAIVTCGGLFDSATGHYVDNVIVWARQIR
jgi:hypothetical protein